MGRLVFRVVGLLAIAAMSLFIGVKWIAKTQKADFDDTVSRLKPLVEVAPVPEPNGLPLRGEEGVSADGFPRQWVDQAGLRSLLIHRRFAALDAAFAHFQDAFEKDPRFERWPADATAAFASSEPALRPLLDEWLEASPQSFAPWLARGSHQAAVAHNQRGSKWAKDTTDVEFAEMRATIPLALADLEHALSLRPRLLAALGREFHLIMLKGDLFAFEEAARRADALCPSCFLHRVSVMKARQPRWGGSYEEMKRYAASAPVKDNPRLALLPGYIELDVADVAIADGREADALAASDRALAFGDHWAFLLGRGHVLRHRKENDAALIDLSRALQLRPGNPDVLVERAEVYFALQKAELAAHDLLAALRVEPSHVRADQLYGHAVWSLIHDGLEFHNAGRREDALRVFDLASELAPLDGEVLGRRAMVLASGDAGIEVLRAAVDAAPDDLRTNQTLDYALAKENRYDEVVALWNRYLSKHADDGRAYMERAGALNHLGRRPEVIADLERACELGVTEGCARLRK